MAHFLDPPVTIPANIRAFCSLRSNLPLGGSSIIKRNSGTTRIVLFIYCDIRLRTVPFVSIKILTENKTYPKRNLRPLQTSAYSESYPNSDRPIVFFVISLAFVVLSRFARVISKYCNTCERVGAAYVSGRATDVSEYCDTSELFVGIEPCTNALYRVTHAFNTLNEKATMAVVQQPAGRQRAGKIAATQEETRSIGSIDPVRSPRGLSAGASTCA